MANHGGRASKQMIDQDGTITGFFDGSRSRNTRVGALRSLVAVSRKWGTTTRARLDKMGCPWSQTLDGITSSEPCINSMDIEYTAVAHTETQ